MTNHYCSRKHFLFCRSPWLPNGVSKTHETSWFDHTSSQSNFFSYYCYSASAELYLVADLECPIPTHSRQTSRWLHPPSLNMVTGAVVHSQDLAIQISPSSHRVDSLSAAYWKNYALLFHGRNFHILGYYLVWLIAPLCCCDGCYLAVFEDLHSNSYD